MSEIPDLDARDERDWGERDAWLFVAVCDTRRGRLANVLFTADYYNKAVPSREELDGALRRLCAAGYLQRDVSRFRVTAAGRELRKTRGEHSIYAEIDRVGERLHRVERPAVLPEWRLGQDEYDRAVEQYHQTFQRLLVPIRERLARRLRRGGSA